jgi:competence protein ComFC
MSDHSMTRHTASLGRSVLGALGQILFPRVCGLCGAAIPPASTGLCGACLERIVEAGTEPYCIRCGASVGPFGGSPAGCAACRTTTVPTAGFARVGAFAGDLAELIRWLKFRGGEYLDRCVGRLLAGALREIPWFGEVDVLTHVPTCWQHRMVRRFHAATAIVPYVAAGTGWVERGLLRRIRGGPHQVGLSRADRVANVKGKFAAVRGVALNGAVVCLIDDVATTGATVFECARVLKRAGASKVFAAVVGHAGGLPKPPQDV